MAAKKTSVVIVGAGGFAKVHARCMLGMEDSVRVAGFVEPSDKSREGMAKVFTEDFKKKTVPPFYNTLEEFLAANRGPADCAVVVTPHNLHAAHVIACMRAGMDTLVEKPMVLSAAEARRVMKARDETGRLFSVAFPGSYSPAVHKAKELIAAGEIGEMRSIAVYTHQHWMQVTVGTWRQIPKISGGGFLFDTGSHAVNTMIDLAGSDVMEMAATIDNRGTPVDISSAISGRFKNGVFFTLGAEGNSINCMARITVMGTEGVLVTGSWGECLRLIKPGKWQEEPVEYPASKGTFEQFLRVRKGEIPNPCPAEVGLRFAKFMDMVRKNAKYKM
ncbi:MAG: Gfo/Idh/MocA family oxidoreductase [Kiritimatiellaeota bacterium]|nr:Gfo/Idh/MocA family oxidoreductase [Kiritimatiellota bacterium]